MPGGLVLRLRPREKLLVNGVVIENGSRRARIMVRSPDAQILRLRDAMPPEEATTPARRLYYVAQLALIGETDCGQAKSTLVAGLTELGTAMKTLPCAVDIEAAREHADAGRFYQAMRCLGRIVREESILFLKAKVSAFDAGRRESV